MPDITEKDFETTIEAILLAGGLDSPIQGEAAIREIASVEGDYLPGGYRQRLPENYDKSLCLLPQDVLDFILATQPKEFQKLLKNAPGDTNNHFLQRLSKEISSRGVLDVI